ncbi:hypothetical protein A8709_08715 [Paenibacillus pectinilyticus]|uniref:Uncharacterized protein n=1 Tax=Paenibacillus pectinilyticus TaxID=512399 RepID=A0A1C1A803_9BACL|nr:hypothetical protein [Paenibacillus pectinilyticus]OCT16733.1 hypothetical protein A8709_08715 [Paenibacillus pectinilyticus]
MQAFHPITEKTCRSLVGKPVLLVLNNGVELAGIVSRIEKNKLILNDSPQAKLNSTPKSTKTTIAKKGKKQPVQRDMPTSAESTEQLSSFGLPLFGGPAPAPRPTGPVDIQIDYIAALFSE